LATAQSADPAVTGANFSPNQVNVGATSALTVSFANTGSTTTPINSIELTISTADSDYTTTYKSRVVLFTDYISEQLAL